MSRDTSNSIQRGEPVNLTVDQVEVSAYTGETLATVLLAQGITTFNRTLKGQPRGPYCNMGTCYECQVQMAPQGSRNFSWVRSCMVAAEAGMNIITGATISSRPASGGAAAGDTEWAGLSSTIKNEANNHED